MLQIIDFALGKPRSLFATKMIFIGIISSIGCSHLTKNLLFGNSSITKDNIIFNIVSSALI